MGSTIILNGRLAKATCTQFAFGHFVWVIQVSRSRKLIHFLSISGIDAFVSPDKFQELTGKRSWTIFRCSHNVEWFPTNKAAETWSCCIIMMFFVATDITQHSNRCFRSAVMFKINSNWVFHCLLLEIISWTDRVINEEVFQRVKEARNILQTIKKKES